MVNLRHSRIINILTGIPGDQQEAMHKIVISTKMDKNIKGNFLIRHVQDGFYFDRPTGMTKNLQNNCSIPIPVSPLFLYHHQIEVNDHKL